MEELGLVDDRRFAQDYARELFARKGFGPRRVAQELRRKGIAQELVDELLEPTTTRSRTAGTSAGCWRRSTPPPGGRTRGPGAGLSPPCSGWATPTGQIREALDVEEDWD